MIIIRHSPELQLHLETFESDGATVASVLFSGGRLSYPGRKDVEFHLGHVEPYTLELESRTVTGLGGRTEASIRHLCRVASEIVSDSTLDLLWQVHSAWSYGISIDRLVAALVGVQIATQAGGMDHDTDRAAHVLVMELAALGFFPSSESLEELFDGAPPACVGLGLVDIDWKI